jgi:plasmid stabilization system protein ParE
MKVVLSDRARLRLRQIHRYIAEDNPVAAERAAIRIRQTVELLADFPRIGRIWEDGETRALNVSGLPYRVHYRIDEDAELVQIITIAHTSRKMTRLD